MSNILAISVSLKSASVALDCDGDVIADTLEADTPTYFVGFISELLERRQLQFKDIDKLIVASGPGSFTGLRVGISFAKALRELLGTEVICASYFDVLRALYADIKWDLLIINSENPNEFYYQEREEMPNTGIIDMPLSGEYGVVIRESNEGLSIKAEQEIIVDNLHLAKNLLLLQNQAASEEITPLYIKPPYTANKRTLNGH